MSLVHNTFGILAAVSQVTAAFSIVYGHSTTAHNGYSTTTAKYGGTVRYVVASGGTDSGPGTIGSPWATIAFALQNANAGDTIYLRGGTYGTVDVNGSASGTAGNLIHLCSYPGEWAVIDGQNGTSIGIFFQNNDYVHFESFEIKDCGNSSNDVAGYLTIDTNHIIVENIYVHNCTKYAFNHHGTCDDNKYINCTAKDNVDVVASGGNADGFHIGGNDAKLNTNTSYYRCLADGNSDDGFDAWAGHNAYFEDCVAVRSGKTTPSGDGDGFKFGGMSTTGGTGQHTYVRCIAYFNKLHGFNDNGTIANADMKNCVSCYNSYVGYDIDDEATPVFTATNCISYANVSGDDNGANLTVTTCKGQGFGGTLVDADFVSVDFADLQSGTFMKPADSTLIDQGTDVGLPYSGSAPDIGVEIV
jgi:hypothetical protein